MMLTVFFSTHGAIFINWRPPRENFNSGYFCEQKLGLLSDILHSGNTAGSPRPIAHFDDLLRAEESIHVTFSIQ
jgi:hypothetical protein